MSFSIVGCNPGRVYTPEELVRGTVPPKGTRCRTHEGKEYIVVEIAASQNVVSGQVGRVGTAAGAFTFSLMTAGTEVPTVHAPIAVAVVSATASASMLIWAQIYGKVSVLCSLSALPFVQLRPSITGTGTVDDGITSLSSVIDGMWLTATSGLQDTLCAAFLNYPVLSRQSIA